MRSGLSSGRSFIIGVASRDRRRSWKPAPRELQDPDRGLPRVILRFIPIAPPPPPAAPPLEPGGHMPCSSFGDTLRRYPVLFGDIIPLLTLRPHPLLNPT